VAGIRDAQQVAVGSAACALAEGGRVLCWGPNYLGQLGDGSTREDSTPKPVLTETGAVLEGMSVLSGRGGDHFCAAGDRLYCWGSNYGGNLGVGKDGSEYPYSTRAVEVAIPFSARLVSANFDSTLAHDGNGRGCGWGLVRGVPSGASQMFPGGPRCWDMPDVQKLAGADHYYCLLKKSSNNIQCWGHNGAGRLGVPFNLAVMEYAWPGVSPTMVRSYSQIELGVRSACGLRTADRQVECWGGYENAAVMMEHQPRLVPLPGPARGLGGGLESICAILDDGSVSCWRQYGTAERNPTPLPL
jgi:alpha-tubulin suppressor-like RCC1 family protein